MEKYRYTVSCNTVITIFIIFRKLHCEINGKLLLQQVSA